MNLNRFIYLIVITISLLSCSVIEKENRALDIRERILNNDRSQVLVVAHRGDWRYAPENSIAAIKHSIEIGVDIVEIDLQMTKDSILIVMHDSTLERTTNGKGAVAEHTWAEIKELYLKNGCGIKTKHRVPSLEEALLEAKGKVLVNLDKADRYFDLVMPILEKTGTAPFTIMKGGKSADDVKELYGKYLNDIIYMPVVKLHRPEAPELMRDYVNSLNICAYEFVYEYDTQIDYPRELAKQLSPSTMIWYNTLWDTLCGGHDDDLALEDCDASYGFLIDELGASIIQTDRAELLLNYLKKRKLHK